MEKLNVATRDDRVVDIWIDRLHAKGTSFGCDPTGAERDAGEAGIVNAGTLCHELELLPGDPQCLRPKRPDARHAP
jgi:hypothetical protein